MDAVEALLRGDEERGAAGAAMKLGLLLAQRGAAKEAEEAYRRERADSRHDGP